MGEYLSIVWWVMYVGCWEWGEKAASLWVEPGCYLGIDSAQPNSLNSELQSNMYTVYCDAGCTLKGNIFVCILFIIC